MLPTPELSHLKLKEFQQVYVPAEDTFLLLDALEMELDAISATGNLRGDSAKATCIELGSGSGCVSTFLAQQLLKDLQFSKWHFYCTDINAAAVEATRMTMHVNGIQSSAFTVVNDNFCDSIERQLCGNCDIMIFNPPYVVTSTEELQDPSFDASLSKAWAGGIDGREVIDDFLFKRKIPIKMLRNPGGVLYLVVINANRPDEIIRQCHDLLGLKGHVVVKRKCGREYLHILKLYF